ncbi:MAG: EamA family transporter [Flavobacteriales bacterium]|nr:EamA family transporter [Flavobacteriales bacterium]
MSVEAGQLARARAYVQIHTAVVLFGITAILGKLIAHPETALVWHRMWISSLGLLLIPGVVKGIRAIPRRTILRFCMVGVLVSLHWLTFYGSIKLGNNASITLACLATASLFTSFLEPLITRSRFQKVELILGLMVILGIYFISGVGTLYFNAIVVGLISAFLAAFFSVLNKKYIEEYNVLSVSVLELGSGFLFLTLILPFYEDGFTREQFALWGDHLWATYPVFGITIQSVWYLVMLSLLCTSLAYVLSLSALKVLSAFTTNLAINLEPVYGIILAVLIFHEDKDLSLEFYAGTLIILLAVLLHPYLVKFSERRVKARIIREN